MPAMTKHEMDLLDAMNEAADKLGLYCLPGKREFIIYNKANNQVHKVASVDRTDGRSVRQQLESVAEYFRAAAAPAAPASTQAPLRGHDERIIRNHPDQPRA